MKNLSRQLLGVVALLFFWSQQAVAQEEKYALVIGVKSYAHVAPLANTLNDARDMSAVLKSKGFKVVEIYDPATKRVMQDGIVRYFKMLEDKDNAVGLVYYSGHGLQVKGVNYLIPTQANLNIEADLDDQCVNMDYVMRAIEQAGNGLNIFILDACRNNPFRSLSRSTDKGLSSVNAPKGSYVVYATAPGSVASDGTNRNGLFTSKLLQYINTPNLALEQVFKYVARDVQQESGGSQVPWINYSYFGDFYFSGAGSGSQVDLLAIQKQQEEADRLAEIRRKEEERQKEEEAARQAEIRRKEEAARKEEEARMAEIRRKEGRRKEGIFTESLGGVSFKMIGIEGGSYQMGDTFNEGGSDEKPVHPVSLSSYFIGETEVTLGQFRVFIEATGYRTDADKDGGSYIWTGSSWEKKAGINWKCDARGAIQGDAQHPVLHVSWNDAVAFCQWLAKETGEQYRLPTEAEWEYAARERGRAVRFGNGRDYLRDSEANYDASYKSVKISEKGIKRGNTVAVKSFAPNSLGLYDMAENVWEWCSDWYGENYYASSPSNNPKGPGSGTYRVLPGGSWSDTPEGCRAARRFYCSPTSGSDFLGFRLALGF